MAEAETAPPKDITTVDSENARNEFAQVLKTKRAGPDASVVRKIVWFWSTLADLDLHGKDSYRVVAAARRLIEGALPAGSLSGFSPIQARRGMLRTEKKSIFGKPQGFLEVNLVAKDQASMVALVAKLRTIGLHAMADEDSFDEKFCCHVQVPKLECLQPLYKDLVDLGGVTKLCFAQGGGVQGQTAECARLIIDVPAEELCRKIRFHSW